MKSDLFKTIVLVAVFGGGVACGSEAEDGKQEEAGKKPPEKPSDSGQTDSASGQTGSASPVEVEEHPSCDDQSDCKEGMTCVLSVCRAVPLECRSNDDCPEAYACALQGLQEACPDCMNSAGCVISGTCEQISGVSCDD